jgi:hypothetical protein
VQLLSLFAAAAVSATTHTVPARAVSAQLHLHMPNRYATHPYWQGTPTDRLPIWRDGYYQGNDPDNFIRLQLMRDPPNPIR